MNLIESLQKKFYRAQTSYYFMKTTRVPNDTPTIFKMNQSALKAAGSDITQKIVENIFQDLRVKKAWEEKYWPALPSFAALKSYPEKSFGKVAADFFEKYDLDADLFPGPDFSSPEAYLTSRFYQAHDFWHVLTGYSTSIPDELALQAFGVGQYNVSLSVNIVASGLVHLLRNQADLAPSALRLISEGLQRGTQAQPLLSVPVLERLQEPLETVQADLQIPPRSQILSSAEQEHRSSSFVLEKKRPVDF